jgi:hypothetical protein
VRHAPFKLCDLFRLTRSACPALRTEQVGEPAAIQAYFGIPDQVDSYKRGISTSSQAAQKVEVAFSVTYPNQAKGAIWLTLAKEGDEWKILNVRVTEK